MSSLTQEKIEEFFYIIMEELRKENIPILNDFKEIFDNIEYASDLKPVNNEDEYYNETSSSEETEEIKND